MHLKHGSVLQGGKYKIEKLLGQGGFGITYLAVQTGLNRKVAIKEFFMKEHCNRDVDTSYVSVPSVGSRELVAKFRSKFIKEAGTIAALDNPHVVRIHDVFEENGTAYYVMEYLGDDNLGKRISPSGMPHEEAVAYVRQIAEALSYIHSLNILHLDVKPSNVLFRHGTEVVIIDFGISKHYDGENGGQTSTSAGCVSEGYSPMEQYEADGVSSFTAATDIYSLGATLYHLLCGRRPAKASVILNDGLDFPESIPQTYRDFIKKAMQPRRKDRPQSMTEFLDLLDEAYMQASKESFSDEVVDDGQTQIYSDNPQQQGGSSVNDENNHDTGNETIVQVDDKPEMQELKPQKKSSRWLWWLLAAVMLAVAGVAAVMSSRSGGEATEHSGREHVVLQEQESQATEAQKMESDLRSYNSLMDMGSEYESDDAMLQKALEKYQSAKEFEAKWPDHSSKFDRNASSALERVERRIAESKPDHSRRYEADLKDYNAKMDDANKKSRSDEKSLKEAKKLYEEAAKYETRYKGTEYASSFVKGAAARAKDMQSLIDNFDHKQSAPAPSPKTSGSSPIASMTGIHKDHEWVDLGLSVKWATCNVGASTPGDCGNYYAWGETSTKSEYRVDNCSSYGKTWSDIGGDSSRDAARANWGGSWRMPTKAELEELKDNCTWTWTTQNGHKGYKVTGKNGQSIFLPAAGSRGGDTLYGAGGYGYYWSSTPNESDTGDAYDLYFSESYRHVYCVCRDIGFSVRPVLEN